MNAMVVWVMIVVGTGSNWNMGPEFTLLKKSAKQPLRLSTRPLTISAGA